MRVSVIIVTYYSEPFIERCLNSIFRSTYKDVEIIVVDNNSKDGTLNILNQYKDKIKIISLSDNVGFSAANNIGAKNSTGDILFFLNHDAFVFEDCIEKLMFFIQSDKNSIAGPQLLHLDNKLQNSMYYFPEIKNIISESLFLSYYINQHKKFASNALNYQSCDAISGAALMIGKDRFYEIGCWDEKLFWMDDIDLCYRNKKMGGEVVLISDARCYHIVSGSARHFADKVIPNQMISKLKFFKKYYNKFYQFLVFVFLMIHCLTRIVILLFLLPISKDYRKKMMGYLKSLYLLPQILISDVGIVS